MTAANRIKTSDIREGMVIRVAIEFTPPLGKIVIHPAKNLRDSQEVVVVRATHYPGVVPGKPYGLAVALDNGRRGFGDFAGFQTHMRSKVNS